MNPDKCGGCRQHCDPLDPEYCVWNGQRWHVSCALKQANIDIETIREKQGRYDTTAANYSALQTKIDDLLDSREGLLNILREVPEQTRKLGMLFMPSEELVKRDPTGHLLEGGTDPHTIIRLPDAERARIDTRKQTLLEE